MVNAADGDGKVNYTRGVFLFDRGEYEQAIGEFQTALQSMGENAPERKLACFYMGEAYTHLGMAHLHMRMYRRAEEELRLALMLHPEYPDLHYELGLIHYEQGRYAAAEEAFQKAVSINPRFAKALMHLGIAWVRAGREDGFEMIARAGESEPVYRDNRCTAARECYDAGDIRRAVNLLEEIAGTDVDHIGSLEEKALRLIESSQYREAIPVLVEAVSTCPQYADLRYHLGMCYLHEDMIDMARGQFAEAIRINPRFSTARIGLASCYERMTDAERAVQELQRVLSIDPQNSSAAQKLRQIRG